MKKTATRNKGDRVVIGKPHPWEGHSGVIEDVMHTPVGQMWRVKLDNGMSAGVTDSLLKSAE